MSNNKEMVKGKESWQSCACFWKTLTLEEMREIIEKFDVTGIESYIEKNCKTHNVDYMECPKNMIMREYCNKAK